jgi:hypothetical protein
MASVELSATPHVGDAARTAAAHAKRARTRVRRAVRRFVRIATRHDHFLNLYDPVDLHHESIERAFAKVERASWRAEGLKPPDGTKLADAVLSSVPRKHRKRLSKAFGKFEDVTADTALVREQAAYLIGLSMGRRIDVR